MNSHQNQRKNRRNLRTHKHKMNEASRKNKWINQHVAKIRNLNRCQNVLRNFADFFLWSGAKVCLSCRSWKMLQNDYLFAKIGVNTAENGLPKETSPLHQSTPGKISEKISIVQDIRCCLRTTGMLIPMTAIIFHLSFWDEKRLYLIKLVPIWWCQTFGEGSHQLRCRTLRLI